VATGRKMNRRDGFIARYRFAELVLPVSDHAGVCGALPPAAF
jgi:hypothetical protein